MTAPTGEHVFGILSTLDSLKTLNLSDNFLNEPLSEQATKLVNLEELLLDVNQISALPKALGAWSKLRVFSAAENEITELPADVGEWRESVFINLRNNKLKELPNEVGQWVKLERLYLGCNQLQGIPQEFGSLTSLVELELRNNQIAELPMTLSACARLQKLHLGNNKIVEVPSEILSALLEVEELHLYKNKLESLPPELGCLTKCHTMSFSTNNLRTLPDEVRPARRARSSCSRLRILTRDASSPSLSAPSDRKLRESGGVVPVQERKVFVVSRASWPAQGVERASGEAVSGAQIAAELGVRLG